MNPMRGNTGSCVRKLEKKIDIQRRLFWKSGFYFFIKKSIYFCLHWVFIAVLGLLILVASPVAEHGL